MKVTVINMKSKVSLTSLDTVLWVFAFSFVCNYWNTCSVGLRAGVCLDYWRKSHFFLLRNSWVSFTVCFDHYLFALWSTVQSVLKHLSESEQSTALYTSQFIMLLLSSINTNDTVTLAATHAHAVTLPSSCLTDNGVFFQSRSGPSFLRASTAKSNLTFLYISVTNGLHLVVNPLYSPS